MGRPSRIALLTVRHGATVTAFHDHGLANRWFDRMEACLLLRPALPAALAPVGVLPASSRMGDTTAPNSGDDIEFQDAVLPLSDTEVRSDEELVDLVIRRSEVRSDEEEEIQRSAQ